MTNILLEPGLYLAVGGFMGFLGGCLFYGLWRRLLSRSASRNFWRTLPVTVRSMLMSDEPRELLSYYRTLIAATARYAGFNLLGVMVGITPITVIFLLLYALDPSSRVAASVEVHPAMVITHPAELVNDLQQDKEHMLIDLDKLDDSPLQIAGQTLDRETLAKKQAFCKTTASCLMFGMMMFETHKINPQTGYQVGGSVVVRPVLLDSNPFWPYLNDLDFLFFLAVMLGSVTAAWWSRHRRVDES